MFYAYFELLVPKVWKCQALLVIISWSGRPLEYAIYCQVVLRYSESKSNKKNGRALAKIRLQFFFVQIIQIYRRPKGALVPR